VSELLVDDFTRVWARDSSGLWTVSSREEASHLREDGKGPLIEAAPGSPAGPAPYAERRFNPPPVLPDRRAAGGGPQIRPDGANPNVSFRFTGGNATAVGLDDAAAARNVAADAAGLGVTALAHVQGVAHGTIGWGRTGRGADALADDGRIDPATPHPGAETPVATQRRPR
jgi:hypothetical protein